MTEVLRLKAELAELEVIVETVDGEEKKYKLRELIGKERNKYLNKMSNRVKMSPSGKILGMKNFDGMQADLLQASLIDEMGDKVSVEDIEAMPASMQQTLFEKAQELSGLDNSQDDEEKN